MMVYEIGRTGIPESTVNLARIWLDTVKSSLGDDPHEEFRSTEPGKNVTGIVNTIVIKNPSGGETTTTQNLQIVSKGMSVDEMGADTEGIKRVYGKLAESAWEILIEGKRQSAQHTEHMNRLDAARKGLQTGPMQGLN